MRKINYSKELEELLECINGRIAAGGSETVMVTYQAYGGCGIHLRYPSSGEASLLGCTTYKECYLFCLGYYKAMKGL